MLQIPVGTDYLALEINVIENVVNDATAPESDGHFVDDASLEITLAPPVPALSWWGALGLVGAVAIATVARRTP